MGTKLKDTKLDKLIYLIGMILFTACTPYPTSKIDTVIKLIHSDYVNDINHTKFTDNTIQTMLKQLDPHTVYLNQDKLNKFLIATTGNFGGVGISMHIQNHLLTVVSPIINSPAMAAGIQSEDVILRINKHSTFNLSIEECVALTKGKVGTNLHLTVLRKSTSKPLLFSIKRAVINPQPLFATLLKHKILYISIPTFNEQTNQELAHILNQYTTAKSIILDLRYNPGGVLQQALDVIDMFIDKGLIVTQKGRLPTYNTAYYATSSGIDKNIPIVVLINRGSASAAEIVSGTLQVYKRATLVGEKSYGKGSVQTLFPLDNDSALKMTIAKYYLANGKCIDKVGIVPDIIVKNKMYRYKKKQTISYAYAQSIYKKLSTHTIQAVEAKHPKKQKKMPSPSNKEIQKDSQLQKAIEILKNSN